MASGGSDSPGSSGMNANSQGSNAGPSGSGALHNGSVEETMFTKPPPRYVPLKGVFIVMQKCNHALLSHIFFNHYLELPNEVL